MKTSVISIGLLLVTGLARGIEAQAAGRVPPTDNLSFPSGLYAQLKDSEGNLFFSPHSISAALAMTYLGARAETAIEMQKVLQIPKDAAAAADALAALQDRIHAIKAVEVRTANGIWVEQKFSLQDKFTRLIEERLGGRIRSADFVSAADRVRREINAWADKQTHGRIKDLIPPGVVDAMTRMVLVNAIYFKGRWDIPFPKQATSPAPFYTRPDAPVDAPMMRNTAKFGYAEGSDWQALEMDYAGKELSMVVMLPSRRDGLPALERQLDSAYLHEVLAGLSSREVEVQLPRFTLTSEFNLSGALAAMGLSSAFRADAADFSGISGARDLFISAVIHKAFVEVNEEGTEAAAATAVIMRLTAAAPRPKPVFRADHPFLFLIREKQTGGILFLGRVAQPQG